MPIYYYRAMTKEGLIVRNKVEEISKQTLIKKLKKLLTFHLEHSIILFVVSTEQSCEDHRTYEMRKCRNWQTSKTKDLVASVPCGFKSHLPHYILFERKCRNWQTSKTKDLVTFVSCGFKSHLPH